MSLTPAAAKRLADELLAPDASLGDAPIGAGENPGIAVASSAATSSTNRVIGRYRILHLLGAGGMGEVLRAVQDNPQREVALKLVRPELVSAEARRRFEHEARILARLQHPGIAQIFDAGEAQTDAGPRPYFAMELVEGQPLTDYAARHTLSTRQRLDLFLKICDAVEHAHRKGVIHRDLKPGNILVNAGGQPKILDFGVARATDADVQVTTLQTDIGKLVGTIPYMSPEQAMGGGGVGGGGDDLDTRSDVYALGVVLYELLSGQLPYQISRASIPEAVRVIKEEEPRPLSSINRTFRGDLETIVAKALEKERERRYASVGELAADVRRYLADEPIVARRASASYQFRKFARRNRPLVGAAVSFATVILLFAGGAAGLAISERNARLRADASARDARRQESMATAISDFFEDLLIAVSPRKSGREANVSHLVLEAARRIETAPPPDRIVEASLRRTIGNALRSLGRTDRAVREIRRAMQIVEEEEGPESPAIGEYSHDLAVALRDLGEFAECERLARRVVEYRIGFYGPDSREALVAKGDLCIALLDSDKLDEAEPLLRQTLRDMSAKFGENDPSTISTMHNLAGLLMKRRSLDEAAELAAKAVERSVEARGADHVSTINARTLLLQIEVERGHAADVIDQAQEVAAAFARIHGEDHPRTLYARYDVAEACVKGGRAEEGEEMARSLAAEVEQRLGPGHPLTIGAVVLVAQAQSFQSRLTDAEATLRTAMDQAADGPEGDVRAARIRAYLAKNLAQQERFAEAETEGLEALRLLRTLIGDNDPRTVEVITQMASFYEKTGSPQKAAALRSPQTDSPPPVAPVPTDSGDHD